LPKLENRKIRPLKVTLDEVRTIVAENDKQRFSLIPITEAPPTDVATKNVPTSDAATIEFESDSDDPSNYLIRANQGHSIKVAEDGLLDPITLESDDLPETVVHGTTTRAWPLIVRSGGLKTMTRTHVHFASGLPEGFKNLEDGIEDNKERHREPVISGMRNTSSVLIYLDIRKALTAGLKFWRSKNEVILSSGGEAGIIPLEFFERVEDRKKGSIIMRDGKNV
jgi:2'-phosphotransferase